MLRKCGFMLKIKEIPSGERPYEKCFQYGANYLTDTELLAVILRTGTSGISAYELASEVLNLDEAHKGLLKLMHLSKEELMQIKGVGKVKTIQMMCIAELAKRISALRAQTNLKFQSPETIAEFLMEKMRHLEHEELHALYLDTKCQLIKDTTVTIGSVNKSMMATREILVEALRFNAVNIIMVHNHPSGDSTPSPNDISSTNVLKKACDLVGICLLDHIVIGDRNYSSLKQLGKI